MILPKSPSGYKQSLRLYARLLALSGRTIYPRPFTHNSHLRLLNPVNQRPQLPFLHAGSNSVTQHELIRIRLQARLNRFITTATKGEFKRQLWHGMSWAITLGLIQIIALSSWLGGGYLLTNVQHPAASEWSFWTLFDWLAVKQFEDGGGRGVPFGEVVDWASVASGSKELLRRLEDPEIDGAGVRPISHEEGELHVNGVARTGVDVSAKSEEWRRCYYMTLLGAAAAAEHLEGWVADPSRMLAFPKNSVVGVTNPNPVPLSSQSKKTPEPPKEEDVILFDAPDTMYMKILTTYGFTSRQRLEAALHYADWLEYKGFLSRAEEVYDWGLDIALGSLPQGINKVADIETGIIYKDAEHVSSNVLLASSSMASFHARHGNLSEALPIFVSVLRARRKLPEPPESVSQSIPRTHEAPSAFGLAMKLFRDKKMPPAPPSGDEVPTRTGVELCNEAGILSNIGEILFASNVKDRASGLNWTREAAELVDSVLDTPAIEDKETREKCVDCLRGAMENWKSMVDTILEDTKAENAEKESSIWFWRKKDLHKENRWESEADAFAQRMKLVNAQLNDLDRRYTSKPSLLSFLSKSSDNAVT